MNIQTFKHVAIIPDGNRRWARNKGKSPLEGHKHAVEKTMPDIFDAAIELRIPFCTIWLLSPENFQKRTKQEIDNLLYLLRFFMKKKTEELKKKNVQLKLIGNIEALPPEVKKELYLSVEKTKENTGTVVTFAINYGGRDEIIRAIQKLNRQHIDGEALDKNMFSSFLDTNGIPDPDLIIRTGGEKRTSGFMLWQSEYTEYEYLDVLFPDFTPEMFKKSIGAYTLRTRRYGS